MLKFLKLGIKFFPLTLRGFSFLSVSGLLLAIGIVRINLALLIWGSSFLFVCLYSVVATVAVRGIVGVFFKRRGEELRVVFPNNGVFPGDENAIHVELPMPSVLLPGIGFYILIRFSFAGNRVIYVDAPLKRGLNSIDIPFSADRRGIYTANEVTLFITDYLGFTRLVKEFKISADIVVYPHIFGKSEFFPRIEGGSEEEEYVKKKRRSEELLEVRKYFPGDDLRRLNWNVFAHTGELFIRIGEERFQTKSNVVVILDCSFEDKIPYRGAGKKIGIDLLDDYLDELIKFVGSYVVSFLNRGISVSILLLGSVLGRRYRERLVSEIITPEDGEKLLKLLSGLYWERNMDSFKGIALPDIKGAHAIVFSSPFSVLLDLILEKIRIKRWRISLFMKSFGIVTDSEEMRFPSNGFQRVGELLFLRESGRDDTALKGEIDGLVEDLYNKYRGFDFIDEIGIK